MFLKSKLSKNSCLRPLSISSTDKISLLKRYGAKMTKFLTNPYFISQRFQCYTTLIVKELLYNKTQFFYFYFKTCRNLHSYNHNKHIKQHNKTTISWYNQIVHSIIKQYYHIIKFQLLSKKEHFSRTNILLQDRSITLKKQAFFDFKNILMTSRCQDGQFIKRCDIIPIQEMVTNCTLF